VEWTFGISGLWQTPAASRAGCRCRCCRRRAIARALDDRTLSGSLDEIVTRRVDFLTGYQNAAWAERYRTLVERVRAVETARVPSHAALTEAVARYAFKLMAYKDEYEVARLYTSGEFERQVRQTFEGDFKLQFHLAPPLLARKGADGHLRKRAYGPWMFGAFRVLARLKFLRGSAFDVFGHSAERRMERALIGEYTAQIDELLAALDADNHALAVEIACILEQIRGYGHVREAHLARARAHWDTLRAAWRAPERARTAALIYSKYMQ